MRTVTVIVDAAEKRPLLFPETIVITDMGGRPEVLKILTETKALETGDYVLKGFENVAIVERKGSIDEVASNMLSKDRLRELRKWDRLATQCKMPAILLEGTPSVLLRPTPLLKRREWEPGAAVHALQREAMARNITVGVMPTASLAGRRFAGEWVVHTLVAAAQLDAEDLLPDRPQMPILKGSAEAEPGD